MGKIEVDGFGQVRPQHFGVYLKLGKLGETQLPMYASLHLLADGIRLDFLPACNHHEFSKLAWKTVDHSGSGFRKLSERINTNYSISDGMTPFTLGWLLATMSVDFKEVEVRTKKQFTLKPTTRFCHTFAEAVKTF